jgi:hypothetical protein
MMLAGVLHRSGHVFLVQIINMDKQDQEHIVERSRVVASGLGAMHSKYRFERVLGQIGLFPNTIQRYLLFLLVFN